MISLHMKRVWFIENGILWIVVPHAWQLFNYKIKTRIIKSLKEKEIP